MATIADRIKYGLNFNNMSQADLVEKTGIGKSSISTYISGKYEPKQRNIYKIAKALNVSEAWLMGLDVPMQRNTDENNNVIHYLNVEPLPKMRLIPLLGAIACGEPILAEENYDEMVQIPAGIDADYALRCKGDSMINARIMDGDLVFIRQQPDVENGEIAAVLINNEATLKRVYKHHGNLILQPENPKYTPFVYTGEQLQTVHIIGKAVYFTSHVR